jgi:DNA repair protein RadA/Sms
VGQVRESAAALIRLAKEQGVSILFIGHVTKDGMIAGPKVLEHMVDTVLYFEGEHHQQYRIIRSIKNRFGSTNELGIFDMQADGLIEVANPSQVFLHDADLAIPGTMTVALMEGTRSLLVEVQALATRTAFGMPRRTTTGVDVNRAMLLIAVLEKKCGLHLNTEDIFINVAGGMSIDDPGADLGIALAIASSFKEYTFDHKVCAIGEIGLGGELRSVTHCDRRVQEAEKLGYKTCIIPQANLKGLEKSTITLIPVRTVAEVLAKVMA